MLISQSSGIYVVVIYCILYSSLASSSSSPSTILTHSSIFIKIPTYRLLKVQNHKHTTFSRHIKGMCPFINIRHVAAAVIVLIFSSVCPAHPWSPHTFDSLEKDILRDDMQTILSHLEAAIDPQSNPVLANLTRTWGPLCMNGRANSILARSWPKEHSLKLQVYISLPLYRDTCM